MAKWLKMSKFALEIQLIYDWKKYICHGVSVRLRVFVCCTGR